MSQLQCLKLHISKLNILNAVTDTKNCQLEKFLWILSSLQKCLFEISATEITKVRNFKFWQNFIKFSFSWFLHSWKNNFETVLIKYLPLNPLRMLIWFDWKTFAISIKNHQFCKYNFYLFGTLLQVRNLLSFLELSFLDAIILWVYLFSRQTENAITKWFSYS